MTAIGRRLRRLEAHSGRTETTAEREARARLLERLEAGRRHDGLEPIGASPQDPDAGMHPPRVVSNLPESCIFVLETCIFRSRLAS
jgi:hypothetical protein